MAVFARKQPLGSDEALIDKKPLCAEAGDVPSVAEAPLTCYTRRSAYAAFCKFGWFGVATALVAVLIEVACASIDPSPDATPTALGTWTPTDFGALVTTMSPIQQRDSILALACLVAAGASAFLCVPTDPKKESSELTALTKVLVRVGVLAATATVGALAMLVGAAAALRAIGLSYEAFAIGFGITISLAMSAVFRTDPYKIARTVRYIAKSLGSLLVEVALVCLALPAEAIVSIGWLGIVPTFIGCMVVMTVSLAMLNRCCVRSDADEVYISTAAATICGSSAATAIESVLSQQPSEQAMLSAADTLEDAAIIPKPVEDGASDARLTSGAPARKISRDLSSISVPVILIVNLSALVSAVAFQLFALRFCQLTGLPQDAVAAFAGTTIDSTGFVAASVSGLDPSARAIGINAKVIQNTLIVAFAMLAAVPRFRFLCRRHWTPSCGAGSATSAMQGNAHARSAASSFGERATSLTRAVWKAAGFALPPFVSGYVVIVIVLTVLHIHAPDVASTLHASLGTWSKFAFSLGFVAIGIGTDLPIGKLLCCRCCSSRITTCWCGWQGIGLTSSESSSADEKKLVSLTRALLVYSFVQVIDMGVKGCLIAMVEASG
ncbi:hypothetical protein FNF29_03367 [Cafeteria roenbergensis]|uniref:Uncharacterized protein n=1 Tax=Cafeteria roenbergensis TaxID=33653 RepID=A0A5A8CKC8_CAFRO|nr:hypothetical protein FNF29_03367 [Cafeteria roenbergensis]|eukprot:KAA0153179.1 hypothetical protein FNF29_03367 [Cafeteria roenbergensis]